MIAAQCFEHTKNGNSNGLIAFATFTTFTRLLAAPVLPAFSQQHPWGMFEGNADVGTINVPSWSPDSKRVAFVGNTDRKE